MSRPQILCTNDDGISAPGLVALVQALVAADIADVHVSAPAVEKSATSQALTLSHPLVVEESSAHQGVVSCWATHGTPADSVMVAQSTQLVKVQQFDLVVSGINRGDNMGLHVLYSGTVGAAREAACKGAAAIAFSLDNFRARQPSEFAQSAALAVHVVRAALGLVPGCACTPAALQGNVVNKADQKQPQGFYLAHMSSACVSATFSECESAARVESLAREGVAEAPGVHVFRNVGARFHKDGKVGGDDWAVANQWVSVTPLGLMQDYALYSEHLSRGQEFIQAVGHLVSGAAQSAGNLQTGGIPVQTSPKL